MMNVELDSRMPPLSAFGIPVEVDRDGLASYVEFQAGQVGCRATGTKGAARVCDWLLATLQQFGYGVTVQRFPIVALAGATARLTLGTQVLPCTPFIGLLPAFPYTVPSSFYNTTAPLQFMENMAVLRDSSCSGAPIIVLGEFINEGRLAEAAAEVARRGGRGLVVPAGCDDAIDQQPVMTARRHEFLGLALFEHVPVVEVARQEFDVVEREGRRQTLAHLRYATRLRRSQARTIYATLGGPAPLKERRVMLAAHYDSAFERPDCPAANDNGVGVAVGLELARCYAALVSTHRHQPRRSLEFVFYDAEEYDAVGCWSACLNLDRLPSTSVHVLAQAYAALGHYLREIMTDPHSPTAIAMKTQSPMSALISSARTGSSWDVVELDTIGAGSHLIVAGNLLGAPDLQREPFFTRLATALFPHTDIHPLEGQTNVSMRMRAAGLDVGGMMLQRAGTRLPLHTPADNLASVDQESLWRLAVLHLAVVLHLTS